jgi:hypothetical protein
MYEGSEKVFVKTWNSGMLEYWNSVRFLSHHSIIPSLQPSILLFFLEGLS